MARSKKSTTANTASKAAVATVDPKAKSKTQVQEVRNQVTNVILDSSVEMARRVVQSAVENGQITTLKYLWETAGLFPAGGDAEEGDSDSLAKILLERMGLTTDIPDEGAEDGA